MDYNLTRTRFPRGRRWELILSYAFGSAAGVVAGVTGMSGAVSDLLGWVSLGWALFMATGGFMAAWGQLWQRWTGERVGIIALYTASWFMAVVLFVVSLIPPGRSTSLALAFLLGSFGWLQFARWKTVNRFAEADQQRANRGG